MPHLLADHQPGYIVCHVNGGSSTFVPRAKIGFKLLGATKVKVIKCPKQRNTRAHVHNVYTRKEGWTLLTR